MGIGQSLDKLWWRENSKGLSSMMPALQPIVDIMVFKSYGQRIVILVDFPL